MGHTAAARASGRGLALLRSNLSDCKRNKIRDGKACAAEGMTLKRDPKTDCEQHCKISRCTVWAELDLSTPSRLQSSRKAWPWCRTNISCKGCQYISKYHKASQTAGGSFAPKCAIGQLAMAMDPGIRYGLCSLHCTSRHYTAQTNAALCRGCKENTLCTSFAALRHE